MFEEQKCYICGDTSHYRCAVCGKTICKGHVVEIIGQTTYLDYHCNLCYKHIITLFDRTFNTVMKNVEKYTNIYEVIDVSDVDMENVIMSIFINDRMLDETLEHYHDYQIIITKRNSPPSYNCGIPMIDTKHIHTFEPKTPLLIKTDNGIIAVFLRFTLNEHEINKVSKMEYVRIGVPRL